METSWNMILWRQFGAAIDMLENAVEACPDSLWTQSLWRVPQESLFPKQFAEFWYVAFHALVWLDLYLSGVPEEEFTPPTLFARGELDSSETVPQHSYKKEELHSYLVSLRQKCHVTLAMLTDDQANRLVQYPWSRGRSISYLELQLYNLRHVQEHAAQLSLFLGQHDVPAESLDWVPTAKDDRTSD